jgi:tetratricopeptide (TPR) repeat protein
MRAGIFQSRGELDAAFAQYQALRDWYERTGQIQGHASTLGSQAAILSLQGRHEQALILLERAVSEFNGLGDEPNLVRSLGVTAGELLALGRLPEARARFRAAAEVARRANLRAWEGYVHTGLARIDIESLDLDGAESQVAQALATFGSLSLGDTTAGLDLIRSELDRLRGRLGDAEARLTWTATTDGPDRERQAELHLSLAAVALSAGRSETAGSLAGRAFDYYSSIGNVDRQAECLIIAYVAAASRGDDAARSGIASELDRLEPRIESPLRALRVRLARAAGLEAFRARTERMAVYARSIELGLGLLRIEAATALRDASSDSRERERWETEVTRLARQSGASLFLDGGAASR